MTIEDALPYGNGEFAADNYDDIADDIETLLVAYYGYADCPETREAAEAMADGSMELPDGLGDEIAEMYERRAEKWLKARREPLTRDDWEAIEADHKNDEMWAENEG